MIRAVGLGRKHTGIIVVAGGWAQPRKFPGLCSAPAAGHWDRQHYLLRPMKDCLFIFQILSYKKIGRLDYSKFI